MWSVLNLQNENNPALSANRAYVHWPAPPVFSLRGNGCLSAGWADGRMQNKNTFCAFFWASDGFIVPHFDLFPQTVYCWGSQCCLKCVRLGRDAVSASLVLSFSLSLVSGLVFLLSSSWSGMPCPCSGLSPKCHVRFVQMFWGLQWWNSKFSLGRFGGETAACR